MNNFKYKKSNKRNDYYFMQIKINIFFIIKSLLIIIKYKLKIKLK